MASAIYDIQNNLWLTPPEEFIEVKYLMRSNKFGSTEVKEVELKQESCSDNAYIGMLPEVEQQFVKDAICIDDEDSHKTDLKGGLSSVESTIFEIQVLKCQNKTICKSEEEI